MAGVALTMRAMRPSSLKNNRGRLQRSIIVSHASSSSSSFSFSSCSSSCSSSSCSFSSSSSFSAIAMSRSLACLLTGRRCGRLRWRWRRQRRPRRPAGCPWTCSAPTQAPTWPPLLGQPPGAAPPAARGWGQPRGEAGAQGRACTRTDQLVCKPGMNVWSSAARQCLLSAANYNKY